MSIMLARQLSRGQKPSDSWLPLSDSGPCEYDPAAHVWENDRYSVTVRELQKHPLFNRKYLQLSIVAIDQTARHDWREFQRIKNDICGDEWEAIELYPAETRLLDPSNMYILYAFPPGALRTIGVDKGRRVEDENTCIAPQRPFGKGKYEAMANAVESK